MGYKQRATIMSETPKDVKTKERPSHLRFPQSWEHLGSDGAGKYVTRVIHRLPDGGLHIWTSRRHRKRRMGHVIHPEMLNKHLGEHAEAPGQERDQHCLECGRHLCKCCNHHRFRPWGWKLNRLTWWIGVIFILGSICFVAGTVPMAFETVANRLGWGNELLNAICFTGSVFFTVGSYLLVFEAININLDLRLEMRARRLEHLIAGEPDDYVKKPLRFWGWEWGRIDYQIAVVQLTGAIIFNINCGMALVSGLSWIEADAWVWTPSTLASCCFVTAGYLGIVEVVHRWWAWQPRDMTWWINLFGLLGAIGFLTSSVVGYFGQGPIQIPQWWGNLFALMMGSWFFLFGTYLLIPEMYLEDE